MSSINPFAHVTAETVLSDLGAVYGVAAPLPVRKHPTYGPGRGGSPPHLTNVRLTFEVGKRADGVEVGTSVAETNQAWAICLLLSRALHRGTKPRLPLALKVNHKRVDLPVDGQRHSFDTYICRREARSYGLIDGREIAIECSPGLLRTLSIRSLRQDELLEFFPPEKEVAHAKLAQSLRDASRQVRREPTPKKALATLGAVYAPKRSRPFPPSAFLGFESDGDGVRASYLNVRVGRRKQKIVVMTFVGPSNREPVLNLLFHRVNTLARLDFPLDLTVTRESIEIPLDGAPTSFTGYICGDRAVAEARRNGGTITVDGPLEILRELELVGLDEKRITETIQARREWERRMRKEFPTGSSDEA